MVTPFKFDKFMPASEGTRRPQRAHGGLGARIDKTQHLKARHERLYAKRQFNLQWARRSVAGAVFAAHLDGRHNRWVGIP